MTKPNDDITWIGRLPNAGGDWGRGIVGTVDKLESDIAALDASRCQLDEDLAAYAAGIKQKKAEIDASIKIKRKLIRKTISRVEGEATTLFADVQIADAKRSVLDSTQDSRFAG